MGRAGRSSLFGVSRVASQEICLWWSSESSSGNRGSRNARVPEVRVTDPILVEASGFFVYILLSLLLLAPADTSLVEHALPEVSVVATRLPVSTVDAPARVTVLGPEAIRGAAQQNVASLLENRSALFIRRYGPTGLASMSFRGTSASQTLVLLDGNRIADPQLGQLDVSLLPTILLDRVEILHGAGSAIHGTDGIGGVVNLRSSASATRRVDVSTTVGAYGERAAATRIGGSVGSLRLTAAAEASMIDGNFPYFDPMLGISGEMVRREGADAQILTGFLRGEMDFGETSAFLGVWAGDADRGTPGSIGATTLARQQDRHLRVWGGSTTRFDWGALRFGGLIQRAALIYNDDAGRTWIGSVDAEARIPVKRWHVVSGVTAGFGTAEHQSLNGHAREGRFGAYVSATGDYGRLLIFPALRADAYLRASGAERSVSAISPRLGLNYAPLADRRFRLKASAGGAFRAPTFNDRFWRYSDPNAPAGDPNLRPERGWTTDLGILFHHTIFRAEVTAFGSWLRDQIVWLPSPAGTYAPINIGRTVTRGVEGTLEMVHLPFGPVAASGGLTATYTDGRDRSNPESSTYDQPLRYVPRYQVKGHLGGDVRISGRWSAGASSSVRYVSSRPITMDGSMYEPAYTVVDGSLRVSTTWNPVAVSLSLFVENLLDTDYAVLRGYPMPPRHGRVRIHLTW